ncbi:U32 family peptidase [uncultured Kiloniella sp.]|uniref:ubiquinone anaerobic biosynthesis protein UbiV n=1 Tax=uncultured Kiloniella sp. TaxID=1133091 RepID=UPI00260AFED0|nr:U32 family peptidase [uncultured Kiloniella sp.]
MSSKVISSQAKLTLGPVLYNWPAEQRRDFYFKIADEAPVDVVYIGEVTCSKRTPFLTPFIPEICDRLEQAGKEVVISTLSLVMSKRERKELHEVVQDSPWMLEANDLSAIGLLEGKEHIVGPFVNVYNEDTLGYFYQNGARRIVLPCELSGKAIERLLASNKDREIEIQAFGRVPLALSARCYHARSHGLSKDGCLYVCEQDPDGMNVETLDGEPFLAVNGTQTMSYTVTNLLHELDDLAQLGATHFRLWPQDLDMVKVIQTFRERLDGSLEERAAQEILSDLVKFAPFSNGFYHGVEGNHLVEMREKI